MGRELVPRHSPRRAAVNGVELEYEIVGEGPELVWLHGLGGNLAESRPLAERLGRHHRVLWYSTRGHGRSTAPADTRRGYGYDTIAGDLAAMLDQAGFTAPLLAGGSHGANTILRHEALYPGRARGLLLIAPGGNALAPVSQRHLLPMRLALWWAIRRGFDTFGRFATGVDPRDPAADQVALDAARTHDLGRIGVAMRRIPDQRAVDPAALARFDVPAQVLAWDHDPVVHPIAMARRIAELIPGAGFAEIERAEGMSTEEVADFAATEIGRWAASVLA